MMIAVRSIAPPAPPGPWLYVVAVAASIIALLLVLWLILRNCSKQDIGMYSKYIGRDWTEKLPPVCPKCEYNLTGISSEQCPECGKTIYWLDVQNNAKKLYHGLRQTEDYNDLVDVGPYVAAASAFFILFFWLVQWADGIGRVIGVVLAVLTICSGMQILRSKRVPEWAREFVEVEPKYIKGIINTAIGLLLVVLAIFLPTL